MLYAVRGNKQLRIEDAEKETYLKLGYDIAQAEGGKLKVISSSPAKVVPYAKHKELLDENAKLKKEIASLRKALEKKGQGQGQNDEGKGGE